jgi:uncharacterized protein
MKPTPKPAWNPDRLDVRAFAQAEGELQVDEHLSRFERLSGEVLADDGLRADDLVHWQAHGDMRPAASGGAPAPWLHLQAQTSLALSCQRCLGPVQTPLSVDRWFRFVADEATAEAQNDACEEDVLALEPRPNLRDLLEDELLMELPLVPMHEVCPVPVVMQAADPAVDAAAEVVERRNPFAELARLKQ